MKDLICLAKRRNLAKSGQTEDFVEVFYLPKTIISKLRNWQLVLKLQKNWVYFSYSIKPLSSFRQASSLTTVPLPTAVWPTSNQLGKYNLVTSEQFFQKQNEKIVYHCCSNAISWNVVFHSALVLSASS